MATRLIWPLLGSPPAPPDTHTRLSALSCPKALAGLLNPSVLGHWLASCPGSPASPSVLRSSSQQQAYGLTQCGVSPLQSRLSIDFLSNPRVASY